MAAISASCWQNASIKGMEACWRCVSCGDWDVWTLNVDICWHWNFRCWKSTKCRHRSTNAWKNGNRYICSRSTNKSHYVSTCDSRCDLILMQSPIIKVFRSTCTTDCSFGYWILVTGWGTVWVLAKVIVDTVWDCTTVWRQFVLCWVVVSWTFPSSTLWYELTLLV